jgi:GT2 family glycosyltransferase
MYGEDSEWGMRLGRLGIPVVYAPRLGTVIHKGAASSHDLWTERERLRRGHAGGLRAYAMLNGATRAQLYRVAQLAGYAMRWAAYSLVAMIRSSEYYNSQRRTYGWLAGFYLRPAGRD